MGNQKNKLLPVWKGVYQRLGLKHLAYDVPTHAQSLPYMLGGLSLACFGILILGGIWLAQYYNPDQTNSNASIAYLITQAPFGNWARSVHYWAANIVFVLILLHMIRAFISGSYKRPRELTWLTGLGLMLVTIGFIFTGTMMSMTQEGLEAMEHNSEAGLLLGKLGEWFTSGFSPTIPLVGRVYVAHMMILPILFVLFIVLHMFFIKVHGISPKPTLGAKVGGKKGTGAHFDKHMVRLAGWSLLLFGLIALLALVRPEPLGSPGALSVEATKPPWMFLWIFGFENLFGIKALIWGPALVFGLFAAIPFIDRSPNLSPIRRWWVMILGAAIIGGLVYLSWQASTTKMEMSSGAQMRYVQHDSMNQSTRFSHAVSRLEHWVVPVAEAHGMPSVNFKPAEVKPGDMVTISGDGLKTSGDYDIFLKGKSGSFKIGTGRVEAGDDMFDQNITIPKDMPGGSYTVEARSVKNADVSLFSPLQLVIHEVEVPGAPSMPSSKTYPIPAREVPWIGALIVASLTAGVGLLRITRK